MKYDIPVPYCEFDEEQDLSEKFKFWALDGMHFIPSCSPNFCWFWSEYLRYGTHAAAETLCFPTWKGMDWRVIDGSHYVRAHAVTDESEQKQREAIFRERARPYMEDFNGAIREDKERLLAEWAEYKKFNDEKEKLTDFEYTEISRKFMYWWYWGWKTHMLWIAVGSLVVDAFTEYCQRILGFGKDDPRFLELLQGVGANKFVEGDLALWRLSRQAIELGLKQVFETADVAETIPKLKENDAGRRWLNEFQDFLVAYGWRTPRMTEIILPPWFEDPSTPLKSLKDYVATPEGKSPEARHRKSIADRERVEEELLSQVPEQEREEFKGIMRSAQAASRTWDDHDFYIDYPHWITHRAVSKEGVRRLIRLGALDPEDDVDAYYLLTTPEIIWPLEYGELQDLRPLLRKRREAYRWNVESKTDYPPLILRPGVTPEEAIGLTLHDPILRVLGIGVWPKVKPELKADLYGEAGAPGVYEGTARLIMEVTKVTELEPGEILVCPATYSSWTPAFLLAGAAVVDSGGVLAHAAIVGREYGVPVVVNTKEATAKIKTGQRLRVDGTNGVVYFLD